RQGPRLSHPQAGRNPARLHGAARTPDLSREETMFSQASEYALRALTELARCGREEWILTGDLAEMLGVPVHYLAKVLQTLARKGVLESQRGRQGGFRLAEAPEETTVYDVVRELDDVRQLENCIMGE